MKLKYYLRGLGIGIIVTTIVLMISFSRRESSLSDEEVIARATQLGMIMPEETGETTETGQPEQEPASEDKEKTDSEESYPKTPEGGTGNAEGQPGADEVMPEDGNNAGEGTAPDDTTPVDAQNAEHPEGSVYRLTIQRGDVCRTVCETLAANGVVDDSEALRKYLFEIGYASTLSTGEYDVPYGLTVEEVGQVLKAGPIVPQ